MFRVWGQVAAVFQTVTASKPLISIQISNPSLLEFLSPVISIDQSNNHPFLFASSVECSQDNKLQATTPNV